jgi:hypothetical protein
MGGQIIFQIKNIPRVFVQGHAKYGHWIIFLEIRVTRKFVVSGFLGTRVVCRRVGVGAGRAGRGRIRGRRESRERKERKGGRGRRAGRAERAVRAVRGEQGGREEGEGGVEREDREERE